MLKLSEEIIRKLTEITTTENASLPKWIDKKYVADCIIPPLVGKNNVHCNIAVAAPVSAGKSTLFNALCGYPILPTAIQTTSCVPTYITRASEQSQECVTVYALKKVVAEKDGFTSTHFVRDESTGKSYYAKDISKKMFEDLFGYMYFTMHGTDLEYKITIENVAYFMKTAEKSDILFNGNDIEKKSISEEDFALSYDVPRHRLLLLLILLCVYVNQNDSKESMSKYTKELNRKRSKRFKDYGFPTGSDYCVCLDWCNDDIPENVTLIDLPGTGADTRDTKLQSSHTALVRGILTEADAIWVLCSDTGVVQPDLLLALKDTIEGNSRKNKVCIYNPTRGNYNNSGPVKDFLGKIPSLTGERCYVVNALAGEYKYTQNGINALLTKAASKRREDDDEPTEARMIEILGNMYNGDKKAYCTFNTSKDSSGTIIVVQDGNLRYTLDGFLKNALSDYIGRLKYEVALTRTIEQAKSYIYIRDSLASSRSILEGIDGKGKDIAEAVNRALEAAMNQAFDNYIEKMTGYQTVLAKKLEDLADTVYPIIKAEFLTSLSTLIDNIKTEWRTLEKTGHPNCLKANLFGNYPLRGGNPNWDKFKRVRASAESKITIAAFDNALKAAAREINKYNALLNRYTDDLKKITRDFGNDYINAFLSSFDEKRDELCNAGVTDDLYKNFNSTRERLKEALKEKLDASCTMVCDGFDVLMNQNGIFDKICRDTDKAFRDGFCENILDKFRTFMYDTFTGTNYITLFHDCLKPEDLHRILNDDFSRKKKDYEQDLSQLIDAIYGRNVEKEGQQDENFPSTLGYNLNEFNNAKVMGDAEDEITKMHENISSLVGFGASVVVDLTEQIKEIGKAIVVWAGIGKKFQDIYKILEDSEAENTKRLYNDCTDRIEEIITRAEEEKKEA